MAKSNGNDRDIIDALLYGINVECGSDAAERMKEKREKLTKKINLAREYSDFNGSSVTDAYERLEYARQFVNDARKETPMKEAYPELWEWQKSIIEAFRGCEVSDRELAAIIAGSMTSFRNDYRACQTVRYTCGVCGQKCGFQFDISDMEMAEAKYSSIDYIEMMKQNMFRDMGCKFSKHCPFSLK